LFKGKSKEEKEAEKLARDIAQVQKALSDLGEISEDTAKKFLELQKQWGTATAQAMMLSQIMEETGINMNNITRYGELLLTVLDEMSKGMINWEKGLKAAGDAFQKLLKGAEDLGLETTPEIIEFIRRTREMGVVVPEVVEYVNKQLEKIPDALKDIIESFKMVNLDKLLEKLGEEEFTHRIENMTKELDRFSRMAKYSFDAMVASGKSYYEALQMLKEPLQALIERYQHLNKEVPEFLKPLAKMIDLMKLKPAVFKGLDASLTMLKSFRNIGYLNQQMFKDLSVSATRFAKTILGVEGNLNDALKNMAKMTQDQINMLLPVVAQFVQAASLFGLNVPAWMKTYVTRHLGVAWGDFKKQVTKQALAAVNTAERLKAINNKMNNLPVIKDRLAKTNEWLQKIHDRLRSGRSYQSGTPYVPSTGIATLHQGEAVLPRNLSVALREFFTGRRSSGQESNGGMVEATIVIDGHAVYKALVPYLRKGGNYADFELSSEGVF